MKKVLIILLGLFLFWQVKNVYPVDNFTANSPAGTDNLSLIDNKILANNNALVRLLAHYRRGCEVVYLSSSTLTVAAGEVCCANSDGTTLRMRANTSSVSVGWSDIDTGSEANSTNYFIYAVGDADTTTFTIKISTNSSNPSGITYFKKLASFYNNSSSEIERIDNLEEDLSMFEIDSDEVQLKQADAIDMQSQKIINLLDPTSDQDAATKAYADSVAPSLPSGIILMWSGSVANIPSGFSLCDGTGGTPNLVNKFIRGGSTAGATGGSDTNSGTHTFSGTTSTESATMNTGGDTAVAYAADDNHTHTYSGTTSAPSDTNNMPSYYVCIFIMKD